MLCLFCWPVEAHKPTISGTIVAVFLVLLVEQNVVGHFFAWELLALWCNEAGP